MTRFLAGLGFGCITGAITYLMDRAEPWWLLVGACTAVLVWTGCGALEVIADALDDLL